jgi:predicted PurR-regulated permease PerM
MWFIYFIFLTWTVVSLVVVYKTLTYGSNFLNGYDTVSAKHLTKLENSDLNKKFGLFLLGTAIVAIVAGTFLSLAITGVNLSYRAYYISGLVQYVSVAMFIILAHAGVIIYSVNKKNFNNSMPTGNAKSQDI